MTLAELKTEFMAILNNRLCTTTLRDSFLNSGLLQIQRELRARTVENNDTFPVLESYNGVPLPDDYEDLIDLLVNDHQLERRDLTTVLQLAQTEGQPRYYARQGDYWILGPAPAEGTDVEIIYYASAAFPQDDTGSNTLTEKASDLVIYSALTFAGDHFTDRRVDKWIARYQYIVNALNDKATLEQMGSTATVSPAYSMDLDDCG